MTSLSEFSQDELASLSPWRLPQVSEPEPSVAESAPDVNTDMRQVITAETIEVLQRQAYEEAAVLGRKEGYEKGYREGYQFGLEKGNSEGRETLRQQGDHLFQLMTLLSTPLMELDDRIEAELVELVVAVAKQLVRRELKTNTGQIVAVVRQALSVLPVSARRISLHLHPEDAELVRAAMALEEAPSAWRIVEDPLLTRGGCRVDTETSRIDATLEKQLAAVIANLLGCERQGDAAT